MRKISRRAATATAKTVLVFTGLALMAAPALAANSFEQIDKGALAMMTAFAVLIVAIVVEATRMALSSPKSGKARANAPRQHAAHDRAL